MDFLANVLIETSRILYEGSFYILLGFFIAGLLHEFMPTDAISRYLGRDDPKAVTLAALFGAPIPLCSCGVLPAAAALRAKGASRSSLMSFLISTPETGVDSIAITYGLLGPVMAVIRPLVAVVTAITAGLVSILMPADPEAGIESLPAHDHDHDHNDDACADGESPPPASAGERMRRALSYGFVTLLDEIAFWMLVGIVLTGVLAAALPDDFFSSALGLDRGLAPMLLMIAAGMPLYLCASASTPVAAALMAKGLSPGAALVFLLVGPATNAATIAVVGKLLGARQLRVYLGSIITVSIAAGLAVDAFGGDSLRTTVFSRPMTPAYDLMSIVQLGAAFVFTALMWSSLQRTGLRTGLGELSGQLVRFRDGVRNFRWRRLLSPPALAAGLAALTVFYLPRMTLIVEPGERGVVQRFGRVSADNLAPGLHWHLPEPLGRGTAVPFETNRRLNVGYEETARGGRLAVEGEAFYLTSDENIIDIRTQVTYRTVDAARFAFGLGDADALVRGWARRELVAVIARRGIDKLYTFERGRAETALRDALVRRAQASGTGIEIVDARFLDVHAPAPVHDAFRDIASALEDRQKEIHVAGGYVLERRAEAEGETAAMLEAAAGDAASRKLEASARRTAFRKLVEVRAQHESVTDYRLALEAAERSLAGTTKYIHDARYRTADVDLWLGFGALRPPSGSALNGIPLGNAAPDTGTMKEQR